MSQLHSIVWQWLCTYLYLKWYNTSKVLLRVPLPNSVSMYFHKNDKIQVTKLDVKGVMIFVYNGSKKCKYLLLIHGLTNTMTMFFLVRMWLISLSKFPILHSPLARGLCKFWRVMKSYLIWRFSMYLYVNTLTNLTPIYI